MIPTKDKIMEIIEEHADTISSADINAVANAIAAQLTLAHRMSEFVGLVHRFSDVYSVPHTDGARRRVWIKPDGVTHCWDPGIFPTIACSDSSQGTTCPHVLAVELWLARQEAT